MEGLAASQDVRALLDGSARIVVHSAYRSTVNLLVDGKDLVCLVSSEVPLHPFGIVVDADALDGSGIADSSRIAWDAPRLTLTFDQVAISLAQARWESLSADAWAGLPMHGAAIEAVASIVREASRSSALGFLLAPDSKAGLRPFADRIARFSLLALKGDIEGAIRASDGLVGLGWGLTPSMDDFYVGLLAALWRRGRGRDAARLGCALALEAGRASTLVSAEFLRYAAANKFGESLLGVVRRLGQADRQGLGLAMKRLLSMGHSSGADTAMGLAVGLGIVAVDASVCSTLAND